MKYIIILSHCNNEKKLNILNKNIETLRNNTNCKIVLTSHIPLSEKIQDMVDYFVYDKSNPILKWPDRAFYHWKTFNSNDGNIKLTYFVDDYGWTPFNQIKKGYLTISEEKFEEIIFMNYDLKIDENILNEINKNSNLSKFYRVKDTYGLESFPSMIFFKINKNMIKKFNNFLYFDLYLNTSHAEKLLENIIEMTIHEKSDLVTEDYIDFGNGKNGDLYNNSKDSKYSLFVGKESPEINYDNLYFFYNIVNDVKLSIDDNVLTLKKGENKIIETKSEIKIFIKDDFYDLYYEKLNDIQLIERV